MSNVSALRRPLPIGIWEVDGFRIKTAQGTKGRDDRRVYVATPGGEYHLLTFASLGALTRFLYRNEDILYPPPAMGGQMVLEFLRVASTSGVEVACQRFDLTQPDLREVA